MRKYEGAVSEPTYSSPMEAGVTIDVPNEKTGDFPAEPSWTWGYGRDIEGTAVSELPTTQSYGSKCDGNSASAPTCSGSAGIGVNTATGAFGQSVTDGIIAAPSPIELSRSYSSANTHSGSLGRGWSASWNSRIDFAQNGDAAFRAEDGSQYIFQKNPDGSFSSPAASHATLSGQQGGFSLTSRSGETLSFDTSGVLIERRDRQQVKTSYGYNSGRLESITSAVGRSARLSYSGDLLAGIAFSDGSKIGYEYSGGRLSGFVDSSGKRVAYAYDSGGRISSITDKRGGLAVQNAYDTNGRVIEQSSSSMTGKVRFSYSGDVTDVTMPDGGIWTDVHKGNVLLAHYDPFGGKTSFEYDFKLDPVAVVDALGNRFTTQYDKQGRPLELSSPVSRQTFTYGATGALRLASNGNQETSYFNVDDKNRLTSSYDPLRRWTEYKYNASALVESVRTTENRKTVFAYDSSGNRVSTTLPSGAVETRTFDSAGRTRTVTDPLGNRPGVDPAKFTTEFEYDAAGRIAKTRTADGKVVQRTYDETGNVTSITNPLGQVTTYAYDAADRVSSITAPGTKQTSFSYNAMGQLASRTDPAGAKTTYTYDKAGRVTSMTTGRGNEKDADPTSFTWKYAYDKVGNRISAIDPAGRTTSTAYDAERRAISVTDPLGNVSKIKYDGAGNIVETTDAAGGVTTYTFDGANQLTAVKDPNGSTLSYTYDWDGNRTSETSPLGFKTTYAYDSDGRQISRTEPRGNATGADPAQFTWRTEYDAVGNVISETDPLGNKITSTYDALSNLVERTDPQGKKTSYLYDALGRPVQTTAPDGGVVKADFDISGNLATRTDANQRVTTYTYDKAGRPTKVTDPLNRTTQYSYDLEGNRTKVTNARGHTITSTFDSRNLLTSTTYSDGTPKISYTYDNAGRPSTITDGTGVRTIGYDPTGRPLTITAPGSTNPFKYIYRADGSVSGRTYPDGRATSYAYDADGRMTGQVQNGRTTTYGWDAAGNLLSTTVPTTQAITETRTYDQAGRMASITEGAGTRQFVRDGSGRVTTETYKDATTTGLPKRYDYDAAGRLTRACSDTSLLLTCLPGTTGERNTFDKVGNRLSATTGATTTNNVFDAADQMTSSTTGIVVTDLTYDADGNLTKDGAGTYSYDALGRAKTTTIGADTFTFVYDADGNRTTTKKNGASIRSHQWDVNNSIPRIATDLSQPSGWLLGDYHYGPLGEPQAVDTGAASFYYLHDRQNSITSVRDSSGVENYKYTYGTWGTFTGTAGGGTQQTSVFGFTGTFKDQVSRGRIDLPARGFDPKAGRFTSPDPRPDTASPTNSSTYAYANNDPVNQSDPSGACPLCISAGIGAAFGAVVEGGIYSWQHRNGGFTGSGLAMAAGRGAVVGGIAGLLMPGTGSFAARSLGLTGGRALATSTAVNAGVGAGFSYAVNEVNCRPTDPWDLLLGAAGGGSSSLIGPAFSWIRSLAAPRAQVFALGSPNAFRSLRKGEGPGASLVRPGADESVEPWEHVMGHENSPWISVTTSAKTMFETYGSGSVTGWKGSGEYGYVSLDLSKTNSRIFDAAKNLTVPEHIRAVFGDELSDNATRHNELLVYLRLEAEAIVHYWPPGTTLEQVMKDIGRS
ncbi:DUF6531 domain-containing protein [Streptomyces virginiae]|uniref:DUF6531 domain-containing protein n=1 Tax=Streptomyces virginiae TaxID=1961 RepID=UPI0036C69AD0